MCSNPPSSLNISWLHMVTCDFRRWWNVNATTPFQLDYVSSNRRKCIVKLFHILILQTFTFSFEFAYSLMQWFYWLPPLEMFPLFLLLFHWFVQKFQALYVIIMHHWQLPVNKMEKNRIKIRTSRWNFGLNNHLAGEDCLKD